MDGDAFGAMIRFIVVMAFICGAFAVCAIGGCVSVASYYFAG